MSILEQHLTDNSQQYPDDDKDPLKVSVVSLDHDYLKPSAELHTQTESVTLPTLETDPLLLQGIEQISPELEPGEIPFPPDGIIASKLHEPEPFQETVKKLCGEFRRVKGDIVPQCRQLLFNLYKFFEAVREEPILLEAKDIRKPRHMTSFISGVSLRQLDAIRKEITVNGCPKASKRRSKHSIEIRLDNHQKSVLREIISTYKGGTKYPGLQKIITAAKERMAGFKCSKDSMRRILVRMGYDKYTYTERNLITPKTVNSHNPES